MKELVNIIYNKTCPDSCVLDMYLPDTTPCPVFIYFHGGGIESGSKDISDEFKSITSSGIALVSVEYRMYPDANFPDFIEDAASAIAYVINYGKANNIFSDIYIGGSSAGAYLTMMTYFDSHYLNKHNISPENIKGWIFDAGQPTVHFNVLRERGLDTRLVRIDESAPLYFVDHDMNFNNQGRIMFLVAQNDMPNRLEQTKLLLKTIEQFNYDMSKVEFKLMNGYSHCSYPIEEIVTDFILNR